MLLLMTDAEIAIVEGVAVILKVRSARRISTAAFNNARNSSLRPE
jgi:hypothetical protein